MTSLNRGFHQEIKETTMRASLKTYATDNLLVFSARLVL
jgi:hypothetical protein